MLSSTLLHVSIDWDELDPRWRYVTFDSDGLWAHAYRPILQTDGTYKSQGECLYLGPTHSILFGRESIYPLDMKEGE